MVQCGMFDIIQKCAKAILALSVLTTFAAEKNDFPPVNPDTTPLHLIYQQCVEDAAKKLKGLSLESAESSAFYQQCVEEAEKKLRSLSLESAESYARQCVAEAATRLRSLYLERPESDRSLRCHLDRDEEEALYAIFGTRDPCELKAIEHDPATFWEERRIDLLLSIPDKVIPHTEFCAMFVRDAEKEIKRILSNHTESGAQQLWYADRKILDDLISERLTEGDPAFHTARAVFYGALCDHAYNPTNLKQLSTKEGCRLALDMWLTTCQPDIKHTLNERLFWRISHNGDVSLFDILIMHSEQYCLSAIPSDISQRHQYDGHGGNFTGWFGLITHGALNHGLSQDILGQKLQSLGLSEQKEFKRYCNPQKLVKGNITTLAQQIQGYHYHSHELPAISLRAKNLQDILFPQSIFLLDPELDRVTTYFMGEALTLEQLLHPQHTPAQTFEDVNPYDLNSILLTWRDRFCR